MNKNYVIENYGPLMWVAVSTTFRGISRRTQVVVVDPAPIPMLPEGEEQGVYYMKLNQLDFTKITDGERVMRCVYIAERDTLYVREDTEKREIYE